MAEEKLTLSTQQLLEMYNDVMMDIRAHRHMNRQLMAKVKELENKITAMEEMARPKKEAVRE
jgi:hypothetical protein